MLAAAALRMAFPVPIPDLPPPVAPYGLEPLPRQVVRREMVFPVLGSRASWRDTYGQRRGSYLHTGQDIRAPKGTPIVAPISGRINMKVQSFWIVDSEGWRVLCTHLNDDTPWTSDNAGDRDSMFAPNLRPGDKVRAGQFIGYVGDSGRATGPHLHIELHAPDGLRDIKTSLKGAYRVKAPVYTLPPPAELPLPGVVRLEACPRAWDSARMVLQVILVAIQRSDGKVEVVTRPRHEWLRLNEVQAHSYPWEEMPKDRPITFYARRTGASFSVDAIYEQPQAEE